MRGPSSDSAIQSNQTETPCYTKISHPHFITFATPAQINTDPKKSPQNGDPSTNSSVFGLHAHLRNHHSRVEGLPSGVFLKIGGNAMLGWVFCLSPRQRSMWVRFLLVKPNIKAWGGHQPEGVPSTTQPKELAERRGEVEAERCHKDQLIRLRGFGVHHQLASSRCWLLGRSVGCLVAWLLACSLACLLA